MYTHIYNIHIHMSCLITGTQCTSSKPYIPLDETFPHHCWPLIFLYKSSYFKIIYASTFAMSMVDIYRYTYYTCIYKECLVYKAYVGMRRTS